jgi:outer membrane protein assembly factor BamB
MKENKLRTIILATLALSGITLLTWWYLFDPVATLTISKPGMDKADSGRRLVQQEVKIGEWFTNYGTTPEIPGKGWPCFRGPGQDNIYKEPIPLIDAFDRFPERVKWKVELGEGHAAPAVFRGRVYLLDYDEKKKCDALRCFSLLTGAELWRRDYKVHLKRNHGLSRTIPAVNEHVAVTIGPKCQVMCVDRVTGDLKWGIDMVKTYGTEVPFWYTGQCPLLDGDTLILAPGGKALLTAIDVKTGNTLWEIPNPNHWKMSHASVIKGVISGTKMYVYFSIGGTCGVGARGPDAGKILWENSEFAPAVVAPTPVMLEGGKILLTAGYGAGTAMLQVERKDGRWTAMVVSKYRPQEAIASEQQTPVNAQGMVYAILPKDAGGARNQFVAARPQDIGTFVVTSGKEERYGLGPFLLADGKFYILNDDGELTIARVNGSRFSVLGKQKILQGQDAWGPLAISEGFLLARDSKTMICIDVRK